MSYGIDAGGGRWVVAIEDRNSLFGGARRLRLRHFGMRSLLLGSLLLPVPAFAQTAAASDDQLPDIIVTARKRQEPIQTVPLTVIAASGEELKARSVSNVGDLARITGNVVIDAGASASGGRRSASIYIRGLGQSSFNTYADPAVGIYLDGVYFNRSIGALMDVLDLDHIEIAKGPQGTLFGKNTMGGAISLFSAQPSPDFGGYGELTLGSLNEKAVRFSVNLPLSNTVRTRVSYAGRWRDGYTTSLVDPNLDLDNINSQSVRGTLQWEPSADVTVRLVGDYSRSAEGGTGWHLLAAGNLAAGGALPGTVVTFNNLVASTTPYGAYGNRWVAPGSRFNYSRGPTGICNCSNVKSWGFSGTLEWRLSPSTSLTAITAYRNVATRVGTDIDGTPLDLHGQDIATTGDEFSQEIRLAGSAFGDRLDWLVGGYYLSTYTSELNRVRTFTGLYQATGTVSFDGVNQRSTLRDVTAALFSQETLRLGGGFSVTGGIRYNYERKTPSVLSQRDNSGVYLVGPTPLTARASWESWTPMGSIQFAPSKDKLLYASISRGFKSGGYQYAVQKPADFLPYGPETVTAYEIGAKTEWFDRRLRINLAGFINQYRGLQLSYNLALGQAGCTALLCSATANVADARIKGAELEIHARPLSGLTADLSVAYLTNRFTAINPTVPASVVTIASKLPRSPEWTASAGLEYAFAVGDVGRLALRADYSYRSLTYYDLLNSPSVAQKGYGLVNARVAFTTKGDQLEFALAVLNLADTVYTTAGFYNGGTLGESVVSYGAPRTFRFGITYRFGR